MLAKSVDKSGTKKGTDLSLKLSADQFTKPPEKQRVLFSGLDCCPGQKNLFETDGMDWPMNRTPGEWRKDGLKIVDSFGATVATVERDDTDEEGCCQHDADLIAAAPDLFEACRSVLVSFFAHTPDAELTLRQVRAAIIKAKGFQRKSP